MATDRFIYFGDEKPTREQVQMVLEDYFGPIAKVTWDAQGARWFATLEGPMSFALQRAVNRPRAEPQEERWVEVIYHVSLTSRDYIDIITREADEATSALANGLGRIFVRQWKGQLE